MKKIVIIIVLMGLGIGSFYGLVSGKHMQQSQPTQVLSAQSVSQQAAEASPPQTKRPGIPVRIMIPSIHLATSVESVGMDSQGRMAVPVKAENTGWFEPGYKPGQQGNAVIDGHYDKKDGSPAAFWNIPKMRIGDIITVTDETNKKLQFAVTKIVNYPDDQFPVKEVFGPSDRRMLNLITCQGTWNKTTNNYSERMVVYSELVE